VKQQAKSRQTNLRDIAQNSNERVTVLEARHQHLPHSPENDYAHSRHQDLASLVFRPLDGYKGHMEYNALCSETPDEYASERVESTYDDAVVDAVETSEHGEPASTGMDCALA
jgi:hypothetical protein